MEATAGTTPTALTTQPTTTAATTPTMVSTTTPMTTTTTTTQTTTATITTPTTVTLTTEPDEEQEPTTIKARVQNSSPAITGAASPTPKPEGNCEY